MALQKGQKLNFCILSNFGVSPHIYVTKVGIYMGIHVYDIYIYIHMYNVSMISLSLHVSKFELENAANQVQLSASDMKTFDLDCSLMKKVPRYVQFFVNWSFKGDFN